MTKNEIIAQCEIMINTISPVEFSVFYEQLKLLKTELDSEDSAWRNYLDRKALEKVRNDRDKAKLMLVDVFSEYRDPNDRRYKQSNMIKIERLVSLLRLFAETNCVDRFFRTLRGIS